MKYIVPVVPPPDALREAARSLVLLCYDASDKKPFLIAKHPDSAAVDTALWELEKALRDTASALHQQGG